MKKEWLFIIIPCFLVILVLAAVLGTGIGKSIYKARYFENLPEYPEKITAQKECPICKQIEVNEPCIINLNAGVITKIELYDTAKGDPKHIDASKTKYGNAMLRSIPGLGTLWAFRDEHYTQLNLSRETLYRYSRVAASLHFCDGCLAEINAVKPNCGLLVADFYDKDNLTLHPIEAAADGIFIRHYTIMIESQNESTLSLKMKSSFFTDNGSGLDY